MCGLKAEGTTLLVQPRGRGNPPDWLDTEKPRRFAQGVGRTAIGVGIFYFVTFARKYRLQFPRRLQDRSVKNSTGWRQRFTPDGAGGYLQQFKSTGHRYDSQQFRMEFAPIPAPLFLRTPAAPDGSGSQIDARRPEIMQNGSGALVPQVHFPVSWAHRSHTAKKKTNGRCFPGMFLPKSSRTAEDPRQTSVGQRWERGRFRKKSRGKRNPPHDQIQSAARH